MGDNTTLGNDNVAQELLQPEVNVSDPRSIDKAIDVLLIVSDGELQVTRHNTLFLVITGGVSSELENLGSEILKNGSKVDWKRNES